MTWQSMVTGSSLAMDAFAVSVSVGACCASGGERRAAWGLAAACGGFQFAMPMLGWLLGEYPSRWAMASGHWLAFALLTFTGGNMIYGVLKDLKDLKDLKNLKGERSGGHAAGPDALTLRTLFSLALATSLDALVVGAGFALVGLPPLELAVIAGVVTAVSCALGVYVGRFAGARFGRWAELFGGVLLIVIGADMLITH